MTVAGFTHRFTTRPNKALSRDVGDYVARVVASLPQLPLVARYLVQRIFDRTVLGFWWIALRALTPVAAMALIFMHVTEFGTPGLFYPVFLLAGMTVWIVVDIGISYGMRSLFAGRRLQRMMRLPAFLFSLASLSMPLIHGAVMLSVLVFAVIVCGIAGVDLPSMMRWQLALFPVLIALVAMLVTGLTVFVSIAFILTRDTRFVVPMLTQVWFFATPVLYPLSTLPPGWQTLSLYLNPLTPIMEASRYALFGIGQWPAVPLLVSAFFIGVVFLCGIWFMMRSEWVLPDMS